MVKDLVTLFVTFILKIAIWTLLLLEVFLASCLSDDLPLRIDVYVWKVEEGVIRSNNNFRKIMYFTRHFEAYVICIK